MFLSWKEQPIVSPKAIKRFILYAKKTAFVVEHDFIMATYHADRVIVFEGRPSIDSTANAPQSLLTGMKLILSQLDIVDGVQPISAHGLTSCIPRETGTRWNPRETGTSWNSRETGYKELQVHSIILSYLDTKRAPTQSAFTVVTLASLEACTIARRIMTSEQNIHRIHSHQENVPHFGGMKHAWLYAPVSKRLRIFECEKTT
ncbi:hypothetical protein C5167_031013 [Papaver somniferum]|nr:hypothetical protein C5167_031013 [Papaver somniferum]